MWYRFLLIPIMLPVLIIKTKCHTAKNNSEVITTYAGHAEANLVSPPRYEARTTTESVKRIQSEYFVTEAPKTSEVMFEDDTEGVVFIPNERAVERNDYFQPTERDPVRVGDLLVRKTVGDIFGEKNDHVETEIPNNDIIFVSGKNNENVEPPSKTERQDIQRRSEKEGTIVSKSILNCTHLNCNNTIKSVCGGKMEHNQWRYRLFLNDCFFRKVNCNFRHDTNRYKKVEIERCKNIGAHYTERRLSFKPAPLVVEQVQKVNHTRRSFSSRRSLSMGVDGKFCAHPCPSTCPDDYDPECAVSSTGQTRVFVNHCKLDYNSCFYGVVWHRRPLAECVGGKKADMRQNRGFIGWMQRVGIVDRRGKLVLS